MNAAPPATRDRSCAADKSGFGASAFANVSSIRRYAAVGPTRETGPRPTRISRQRMAPFRPPLMQPLALFSACPHERPPPRPGCRRPPRGSSRRAGMEAAFDDRREAHRRAAGRLINRVRRSVRVGLVDAIGRPAHVGRRPPNGGATGGSPTCRSQAAHVRPNPAASCRLDPALGHTGRGVTTRLLIEQAAADRAGSNEASLAVPPIAGRRYRRNGAAPGLLRGATRRGSRARSSGRSVHAPPAR